MLILQRESSELEFPSHRNRLLWADGLTGSTPNTTVEAEFWFLLGFGLSGFDHFDGGGGAVAAAESAAGAFFDVVFDVAAEAFGADSLFEGVADGRSFSSENCAEDFAFHCSRSWHVSFSHSLGDEGYEPVHYPWPDDDDADQE